MKQLYVLVGLPRSGKSTWSEGRSEVVVSADRLRWLVYGARFREEGEPKVWYVRGIMLRHLMEQGHDLILDETNVTAERRKRVLKLAEEYGYSATAVVFPTDAEVCKERAIRTDQADLIPVIDQMAAQFQIPTKEEGFAAVELMHGEIYTVEAADDGDHQLKENRRR